MSLLFNPIKIRGITFNNRIFVSPMCQYSSATKDGSPTEWHIVHLGTRAIGGAGLVMAEATSVAPEGRISPYDLGLWNSTQANSFEPIVEFIEKYNSVPAIQLAHAGRKASRDKPWLGSNRLTIEKDGWDIVGPSSIPYDETWDTPRELTKQEIKSLISAFSKSAKYAVAIGFKCIELHFAHGYLANQFLSPISNKRTDEYGGSLTNRSRFAIEVVKEVRNVIPDSVPLFARISVTEHVEGGWNIKDSIELSSMLKSEGVDLIDCSSGGNSPHQILETYPGYQVPFSSQVRKGADILTGAVGMIDKAKQAEQILKDNHSDVVFIGRELLRNPYWPLYAKSQLNGGGAWPDQYLRALQ
jgi:2,4-dienoyl-CoA reductase-like NADH-dependent reductase (Old Yellow Enzyme family)